MVGYFIACLEALLLNSKRHTYEILKSLPFAIFLSTKDRKTDILNAFVYCIMRKEY